MVSIREKFISLLSTLFTIYITAVDSSLEEIERHLEMGRQLLSKGQTADALTQFHAVIEHDHDDYRALHGRATCYLASGKLMPALSDLNHILKIRPSFTSARLERANILFKSGDFDAAESDYQHILETDPANAKEAKANLDRIKPVKDSIATANELFEAGSYSQAIYHYTTAIKSCPSNPALFEKRAACYEPTGDIQQQISDIKTVATLVPDSTEAFYKLAETYHKKLGDIDSAILQVRNCLKLSPEHKNCLPLHRILKKLSTKMKNMAEFMNNKHYAECVNSAVEIIKTKDQARPIILEAKKHMCHCYSQDGRANEAIRICTELIESGSDDTMARCDRADAYIIEEKIEEAIQDFQEALKKEEDSRRAKDGLERAQKLLKQMKKKDYYKILGIKRSANKRQILKAYRNLAQQWHPDRFSSDEEKEAARKRFIDIAAAKEVLTDPEKRRMFDSGEDPLDPEAQAQQHNPFHGFNNPFGGGGGGPFQFKFHFQ